MMPLAGKPMLYRVIERVKRAKLLHKVILATTELSEDDVLCEVAKELKIDVFRGSENDLVDRYYQCAKKFNVDVIVRVCADNPLIEPDQIDVLIAYHYYKNNHPSTCSNTHLKGYPDCIGAELYTMYALAHLHDLGNALYGEEKEHPHKFYYNCGFFEALTPPKELEYPHLKLDVNTKEEYDFVSSIYDKFGNNDFHFLDYVESIDNANSDVQQHGAGNI